MKNRVMLLLGVTALTIASVVGTGLATATPAAAAPAPPTASVGYIVTCLSAPQANLLTCLQNAIQQILRSLNLPRIFPFPTGVTTQPSTGPTAPTLPNLPNLPANVSTILHNLPLPLQTTPLANTASVTAPLHQLVPTHLSHVPASKVATASLPKKPKLAPISLDLSGSQQAAATSANPVSSTDLLELLGIAVIAGGGITYSRRRLARR
ncbi:MAG TPA: hypothetical protein VHC63_08990 [Acidimicrobiales bacterium]|nr:hypothetical protein [Acidimicrobiales bacterium]